MTSVFGANLKFIVLLWVHSFSSLTAGAPFPSFWGGSQTSESSSTSAAEHLRTQYNFPKEILAVLSIIGGDIIQKACAQEAGTSRITPVAFSFGWVAYAFSALMSAFSDGSLMPETDVPSVVIDVNAGHSRRNESWVLGRLIRDLELDHQRKDGGLGIYFYKAKHATGKPCRSLSDWFMFVVVVGFQFALAVLPIIYDHTNWSILYVTGAGTLLAFCSGSLPSWTREKYNEGAPKARPGRTFALTRGNGHGHVFVITIEGEQGKRVVVPFDLLATIPRANPEPGSHGRWRRFSIGILALCWVVVLIAVGGMEKDTWMLLLIGGVGMLQNVWVAGRTRNPCEHGIPLEYDDKVERERGVEAVLDDAEKKLPGLGLALLEHFFPAGVNHDHHWNVMRKKLEEFKDEKARVNAQNQKDKDPDRWKSDDQAGEMLIFKNKAGRYLYHKGTVLKEPILLTTNHRCTTHAREDDGTPHGQSPSQGMQHRDRASLNRAMTQ
jgi:hypothetical protein